MSEKEKQKGKTKLDGKKKGGRKKKEKESSTNKWASGLCIDQKSYLELSPCLRASYSVASIPSLRANRSLLTVIGLIDLS